MLKDKTQDERSKSELIDLAIYERQNVIKDLNSIKTLAKVLDRQFILFGKVPVGVDAILGLIPVLGDASSAALSFWVIAKSSKQGISKFAIAKMVWNVVLDSLLGAIPLFGDIFDFFHQANLKNVRILERHLEHKLRTLDDKI